MLRANREELLMTRFAALFVVMGLVVASVNTPLSARAEDVRPPATTAKMDPELQRMIAILATSVLAQFAAHASKGSIDGFDPGPIIESTLRSALHGPEVQSLLNGLVDQAGNGSEGANLSPEMRALLKVALTGVVAMLRNEISSSLANEASKGPAAKP